METRLVLDWGNHGFSGTVVDEARRPVAGAQVTLIWSDKKDGLQCSSMRRSTSDATGRFSFSALAPAVHRLMVSVRGYSPAHMDYDVGKGNPEPVLELRPKAD